MSAKRRGGNRPCLHDVYIHGLCGNCGIKLDPPQVGNSVSMIHSVPDLRVSNNYARQIGKDDQLRLIEDRKLVLLVDLDQTLLHTTHEEVKNDPNVKSFTLWPGHPTYHTKLRPYLKEFLETVSTMYELHIFTFGCRKYAHHIASLIDPDRKYFGERILSRDESVDPLSKRGNLTNLFPCGDAMVCIIDDRTDVWQNAANLIQVKPYSYFKTSISDGAATRISAEDEEKINREADQLLELIGVGGGDDDKKPEPITSTASEAPAVQESNSDSNPETIADANSGEETDQPPEDTDDYLLDLIKTLERIYKKWYEHLDRETEFLSPEEEGQIAYKLPDIKDIIRRYFRKR